MKNGSQTLTATGSSGAYTHAVNTSGPDTHAIVALSGTFTGTTAVVEGRIYGSSVWVGLRMGDVKTGTVSNGSVAVTDSTTTVWRVALAGFDAVRVYASAGTLTSVTATVTSGETEDFGGPDSNFYQSITSAQTFAGGLVVSDSQTIGIGTDSDLTIGSSSAGVIDILAAADNSTINLGAAGNSFDLKVFGADANGFFSWDASANDLKFEDSVSVMFGTGAGAGVGNAGDVEIRWDATDLDMLAAADDTVFKVGNGTNSFDLWVYGNTTATYWSWDASADSLKFEDSVYVGFGTNTAGPGTKGDINITFDGTDLLVAQTTADTMIKWGVSGAGINHTFYGDTATRNMVWDQSNDQLLFEDNAKLAIGSGGGAAGDITFSWNATKMLVAQLTANSAIDWGVDGAGIDMVFYADTASSNVTWDQSADSLIFNAVARLVFTGTTGQSEIHLTDNLADALSIEISGSTDLLVFTTTDDAESVSPIGLRTRQSTAVAITGATTLKLSDSGGIFTVGQGSAYDIDLPSPTTGPGCSYYFSLTAPGANAVTITVAGGAATFVGSLVTEGQIIVATGSTLTFASGAALLGDSIEIRSIATNLYHVRAIASALNGITVS